jgi:uncharacterized repeat protein (TIGR03803 family)
MKLFSRIYKAAVLCAATAIMLPAQTVTTLFSFGETNGAYPQAAMVQGTNGFLYGTTPYGGINCAPTGCGTIFAITPDGTLTTLYSFCAFSQCGDGAEPLGALIEAANGEFYGTTSAGGSSSYCTPVYGHLAGCGTVFKMTPSGLLTTIYNFCSQPPCADGSQPTGLVQAANGSLYGTTFGGGTNGGGTIFMITPQGTFTTLYSFCSQGGGLCTDGRYPGQLVQATNGDLYGTTASGGAWDDNGTVFRITPSGTFTTLYSFCPYYDCSDGASPNGLVQATDGNFYGTTFIGGSGATGCGSSTAPGCGTVFRITPSGDLYTLYSFTDGDGLMPYAGLVQATDKNLYGTTSEAGLYGGGTLFKITPAGLLTAIFNFDYSEGPSAGWWPQSAMVQDTDGNLYGTTLYGGTDLACDNPPGCGTIFSLSVGLRPFVKLQPTSGGVGEPVEVLGSNLTGATAVSFNGTPAIFKIVSNTLITTKVPSGATIGKVRVTTPSGTLVSDVSFRERP